MDEKTSVSMSYSPEALEAFAQVLALGSFSAAARRLGKSQSTISEAISRLEIDLGVALFDRSTKHPTLTEAGRALQGRIEELLAASDKLRRAAGRLVEGMEPRLTLVLSDANQFAEFEARMAELDQRFPEIELECVFAEHGDAINLIQSGRASLGLLSAQASLSAGSRLRDDCRTCRFWSLCVAHPSAGLRTGCRLPQACAASCAASEHPRG